MEDRDRPRPAKHSPDSGQGGGVRAPSKGDSSSPGTGPSSDAPTVILPPDSGSAADSPTIVDLGPGSQSSDAPTMIDVPAGSRPAGRATFNVGPPRSQSGSMSSVTGQPIFEAGEILAQRYEILQILGEGGMGAVYKAKDITLNRMVALKVIRPDLARNQAIIDRFKQELLLAHQVTHKNVIRIYDLGDADGVKFITMEYIEGEDLRSIIFEKKKLSPEEAVDIMQQVCRALEAAHSVGVIHRDLKPQNIMRDKNGRILVMDFGLARTLGGDGMTQSGALIGTMEYMSPEQALAKELDQRSDLFTVGLIFYELLTGVMPFRADSALASLIKRTQERVIPISESDASIPRPLSDIVSKCLERDPNLRYSDAGAILADLEVWQGKRAAATLKFPTSEKPWGQTIPWPKVAAVLTALALSITGFAFRDKLFRPEPKAAAPAGPSLSLAILPFRNASGDPSWDWLGPSMAEMLSTDVGQSAHLRTVSPDRVQQVLHDLRISPSTSIDPDTLGRIAEFSGSDTVVSGQYAKIGDTIRIDATVRDIKHNRSASVKAEAPGEKALSATVDQLADAIRQNLSLAPDLVKELQSQAFKPTSTSVDALRSYNQGMQLARQGSTLEALKQFQTATQQDPQFALAYSRLGEVDAELGYDADAEQASRKANDLSENLPLAEKYLIRASYARILKDNKKAIDAYETLAKSAPDNFDVQYALGNLYQEQGDYAQARAHYQKVLDADPKNIKALWSMGGVELMGDNYQGALDLFNRGLSFAIAVDNQEQKSLILHALGVTYRLMNKPDEAMRNYQQSMEIDQRLGLKRSLAINYVEMGTIQKVIGKPDAALASYGQALKIQQEIGVKKELGDTYIDMGGVYQDRGQFNQALQMFKDALQIQRDTGDENYQGLCLNNIGLVYLGEGDIDNALTYLQQALQLREKLNVPSDIADTVDKIGDAYSRLGRYDEALKSFMRSLDLSRKNGDAAGAAVESARIGRVFQAQGRYGAAISSLQEAVSGLQQAGDRSLTTAEALKDLADTLAQAGRGLESGKSLEDAQKLARDLKSGGLQSAILNTQGDVAFYRGDYKAARPSYQDALKAASQGNEKDRQMLSRFNLARLSIAEGHPQQAIAELRGLIQQSDAARNPSLSSQASSYLAEALVATKDYSRARQEIERDLSSSDKLGLQLQTARLHYLLGTALRLSGNAVDATPHYSTALRMLDDMKKEAGAEHLTERADLHTVYTESLRWAGK
jgi:eukaryotic-like serine/threonine-protein kinase